MSVRYDYIRDGAAIYDKSFAIIRAESDLKRFTAEEEKVAVRIIHSCGIVEAAADIFFSPGAAKSGREALLKRAPILCDAKMVANGITRSRLPADNQVICTLDDRSVPALAKDLNTTRTAAAMELWRPYLKGAIVAIGNAPTALFRLLEMIDDGAPLPACIVGMPVGFVGAAESKDALMAHNKAPWIIVKGRKGGSAMTVGAVNALASDKE
ncbi:MAG: precorrin-8X methylmutase [Alphaproteobacteria bacterium]|nr:precorrin-8X methylmutase [Alphaproteobacteria bacterium]